jgi:hypothetical protein
VPDEDKNFTLVGDISVRLKKIFSGKICRYQANQELFYVFIHSVEV